MASKRRNPLEVSKASASASSSDEEDSEQSDIEEKEEKQLNNVVEEEDEDDESGEEEEAGSGSESESEDESDADPPSPNVSDFTVKPIASKPPMKDSDTPTKPESKPNKKKRVSETEPSNQESSKTKKNKPSLNEDDDGVEESAKKGSSIPRLWSSEDEIVILKGMIEYQSSKGTIMYSDMEAFHEFIKNSLHVAVSKNQLMDKIRRLKKKYLTSVEKGKDGGGDPVFSKPHEGKIFELSKKVWSFPNDSKKKKVKNVVNGNVKKSETDSVGNSVLALPIQEGAVKQEGVVKQERVGVSNWGVKSEKKEEVGSFESNYPCLNAIVESGKFFELTVPMFGKFGMKEMISSIESSKLKELEKKGKKLMMDEAELYLKKLDSIEEQTKLILDAMRASASKS